MFHAGRGKNARTVAVHRSHDARKAAEAGHCEDAVGDLIEASRASGIYLAHWDSATEEERERWDVEPVRIAQEVAMATGDVLRMCVRRRRK